MSASDAGHPRPPGASVGAELGAERLSFLADSAIEFVTLPAEKDIYQHIADRVCAITGGALAVVTSAEGDQNVTVRGVAGLGTLTKAVLKVLGRDPIGMTFDVSGISQLDPVQGHELVKLADALHPVARAQLPSAVEGFYRRVLNIGDCFTMGFSWNGERFGGVTILLRRNDSLKNADLLKAFIGQATVALQARRGLDALRESEQKYRTLFEQAGAGICVVQDETLVLVNATLEDMLGYEPGEMTGRPFSEFIAPASLEDVRQRYGRFMSGTNDAQHFRTGVLRRDGTAVPVELRVGRTSHEGGLAAHVIVTDVSERLRAEEERQALEERARTSQKMEAIGTLAGGIAHDYNNLLTGILGYSNMLARQFEEGTPQHKSAALIERSARRAADLTKKLLGFARRGKLQDTAVDMHRVIRDTVAIVGRAIDKRIAIALDLGASDSVVTGDPSQLEQVVMNLAVNAKEAIGEAGEITFRSDVRSLGDGSSDLPPGLAPGRYFLMTVADDGKGMSPEVRERIFEPFYTTHPHGQGSGMGLAMVYGIVENHRGAIVVDSAPGEGACLTVYLPAARRATSVIEREATGELAGGSGTILVIDDEETVRETIKCMLDMLGYEVVLAEDGARGVETYRRRRNDIDLVVLDMTMPVMGGAECFERLKEVDPEVRVVLASGHSLEGAAQELLDAGVLRFVQKPFDIDELSKSIAAAMPSRE